MRCSDFPPTPSPTRGCRPLFARTVWPFLLWSAVVSGTAQAEGGPARGAVDASAALRTSQAVVGSPVPDVPLTDRSGRRFRLTDLAGKPVLVQFIYTGCIQACPVGVRTLKAATEAARDAFGPDRFHVVTIGFNTPADTADAMGSFARSQGIAQPEWRFAAVEPARRDDLVRAFGFTFAWGPAGIDHVSQVTLVDTDGTIYRQIYGDTFPLPALLEPMRDLLAGQRARERGLDAWLDRVRLLCTVYDPASGRYRVRTSLFFELGGGLLGLVAIAALYVREARRTRRASSPLRP